MLPLLLGPSLLTVALGPLSGPLGGPVTAPPPGPGTAPPAAGVRLSAAPSPGWRAPQEGPVVVLRRFDPPERPWLAGHRGVDLAAEPGARVLAAGAGTVTFAGGLAGRGVVVVSHDGGLRTTYEPVDPAVAPGDAVAPGTVLGVLGTGAVHCGRAPTCLHWGLRRGDDYLDPWLLLDRGRPVLLPP